MKFNGNAIRILRYIYTHNGQTILISDVAAACMVCRDTVSDWVRRLVADEFIFRDGKKYFLTEKGVNCVENI